MNILFLPIKKKKKRNLDSSWESRTEKYKLFKILSTGCMIIEFFIVIPCGTILYEIAVR